MSNYSETADEYSLRDYLAILRRRWMFVLAPMAAAVALTVWNDVRQPDVFATTSRVLIGNSAAQNVLNPTFQSGYRYRELANEISFASSDGTVDAVEDELGLVPNVRITAEDDSDVLIFSATASTGEKAALYANTWAGTYVAAKQEAAANSFDDAIDRFQTRLANLRDERQAVRAPLDALDDQIATEQRLADQIKREAIAADREDEVAETTELQDQLQRDYDRLADDLAPELALIDTEITAVSRSITELQLDGELSAAGVASVVQVASPPLVPINAPLSRNLILALVVGGLIGGGLALLRENLDRTIKTVEDVAAVASAPVLVAIPQPETKLRGAELALAFMHSPDGAIADGYQKLRTSLQFASTTDGCSSILVTSANQSEGKTTTSTNLAWAMAALDKNVVLADIDFRRPRINEVFGIPLFPGLSNHILDGRPLPDLVTRVDASSLVVLPTGSVPTNPGDFLASHAFLDALRTLESEADLVVLDAPPVLPVADALAVVRHVDAVVVTVMAGSTTKDQLRQAMQSLTQAGATIAGIVLVGVKATNTSKYSYYSEKDTDARPSLFAKQQKRPSLPASANGTSPEKTPVR